MDKLDKLFKEQKDLQKFFNNIIGQMSNDKKKKYLYDNILDSIEELNAIQKKNRNKEWPTVKNASIQNISDLLHFIINICMVLNITPDELYDAYNSRNEHIYDNESKYRKTHKRR